MGNEKKPSNITEIVPRRLDIIPHPVRQLGEKTTQHVRYTTAAYPKWVNFSTQKHVRQAAVDFHRKMIWMATWGGVLAWNPKEQTCIRHTSEHGLVGNATAGITVDAKGTVWAAGHSRGLSNLALGEQPTWKSHSDIQLWAINRMASCPRGGVYLSMQDTNGKTAIGKIDKDEPLRILHAGGLESLDVMTMIVTPEDGALWVGNAWGLHRYQDEQRFDSFEVDRSQVRSLAAAVGGGLWVGTNHGLYRFSLGEDPRVTQDPDWPRGEVLDLRTEPGSGNLWIVTSEAIGRLANNTWQLVREPLPFEAGLARFSQYNTPQDLSLDWIPEGHIWVSGPEGLFEISMDLTMPTFAFSDEDQFSNAVQAIAIRDDKVWVGSARGLYTFDGNHWRNHTAETPDLRDIRAIIEGQNTNQLAAGSWLSGLHRFAAGVHVPDQSLQERIVAMTRSPDNTLWAATIDALYYKKNEATVWQLVQPAASEHIGEAIIHALNFQLVHEPNGEIVPTVWVGTSSGLCRYRPTYQLWDRIPGDIDQAAVEAFAVDPNTGHLWVGTCCGLFSDQEWKGFLHELDIRSLVFVPDGALWIGARTGLQHWPVPKNGECFTGQPLEHFSISNSGLPANMVTALVVRQHGELSEVWIGTSCGLACLHL